MIFLVFVHCSFFFVDFFFLVVFCFVSGVLFVGVLELRYLWSLSDFLFFVIL